MKPEIERLLKAIEPRAGPLIITVFGDTIAPHGGAVWLGSLIALMRPFGISERLVRTGVYRLSREGWLEASTQGRKSSYAITTDGLTSFADADARIYHATARQWSGEWVIVQTLPDIAAKQRQALHKELAWQGFGQLSRTTFIRPAGKDLELAASLSDVAAVFTGKLSGGADMQTIASRAFDLDEFARAYQDLIAQFSIFSDAAIAQPEHAFVIRTALIHQYRRILLKDPQLPEKILPPDWPGQTARTLTANLYQRLSPLADRYIASHLDCPATPDPQPVAAYFERFTR